MRYIRDRKQVLLLLFVCVFLLSLPILHSNNLHVGAPTLTGENRTEGYVFVTFDLSWENSWRGTEANNWDAAWIFVKFRIGGGEWQHAKLNNNGHLPGSGTPATVTAGLVNDDIPFEPSGNPAVGAFIYRSGDGFGTFSTTSNKLRWNYAAHGITNATTLEVNVYAIEMVYVPEGEFNVGGGGGYNAFTSTTINTSNATTHPTGVGSLGGQAGGYPTGITPPATSNWPNGYAAFYCMKYEISQQQYVDFLNSLTPTQSVNRVQSYIYYGSSLGYSRYSIIGDGLGNFSTVLPNVACNFITFNDGKAYSDWAGLRPMTELEYEKACRGNMLPTYWDFAWGENTIASTFYTLSNLGAVNEGIIGNYSTIFGNANSTNPNIYDNTPVFGPLRVGVFASNYQNSGRISSGGSFWGIMELTSNVADQCIAIDDPIARQFTGDHGDGNLDLNGNSQLFQSNGFSYRGGHFQFPRAVSEREYIQNNDHITDLFGFRAVRG
jgi:hypothetical protein